MEKRLILHWGRMVSYFTKIGCIPNGDKLRREIQNEAYNSPYVMHPGGTKIYQTIKEHCWWNGVKNDITDFKIFDLSTNKSGASGLS